MHTEARGVLWGKFFQIWYSEIASWAILDHSSALSVALGRMDSDSIWHVYMRQIYALVAY